MSEETLFPIYQKDKYAPVFIPTKATEHSAAYDLYAVTPLDGELVIAPGHSMLIRTNLVFDLPDTAVALVCSRSRLAHQHGVYVLNAPEIIDSAYTDEVKVLLQNSGPMQYSVFSGSCIAQVLFLYKSDLAPVLALEASTSHADRRVRGFGS